MMDFIKTHSHSAVTVSIVLAMSFMGYGMYGAIAMAMFYLGREHSQAEYRYMKLKKINRTELKTIDSLKREAWNYNSFINDLVVPAIVGFLIAVLSTQGGY